MALVDGTNCGFVTTAPIADPAGPDDYVVDGNACASNFTSPSDAVKITEIGWYSDNSSEEANFEVGLYDDSSGDAGNLLEVERTNAKGTTAGWKTVNVDWSISGSTIYWLGVQVDPTTTDTNINFDAADGGHQFERNSAEITLPDPFAGGLWANGPGAIYAVYETSTGTNTQINIGDAWKEVAGVQINIGDTWKTVEGMQVNIGDSWKTIF